MSTAGSILAVDFGNVSTRALLIELVEGNYSLVAHATEPTTARFPGNDVGIGLARVARQLGFMTGRTFVGQDGRLIMPEGADRSGVDQFVATASIGRPLRTVIVGLEPEYSVISAIRAAAGTYVDILATLTLEDGHSREAMLNKIVLARPDLIFIVGGTDFGAAEPVLELARTVRLAARVMRGQVPQILFAGNQKLQDAILRLFEGTADVYFAGNVRPLADREQLESAQLELTLAYNTFSNQRDMGFRSVSRLTRLGVLPNAQSYHMVAEYLGKLSRTGGGVLAFDIGAATSTMAAYVDHHVSSSIRTDIGLGTSARSLVDVAGMDAIRRWLPFAGDADEVIAYALNKSRRPTLIPDGLRALYLEHALLRAALASLLAAARPAWTPDSTFDDRTAPLPLFERIIGAGAAFANTGRAGMTAMLMLDALQPRGVTRLQVDSAALIPALGPLARVNPEAAVQLLDGSAIEDLGLVVNLSGVPRAGRAVAKVTVRLENGTVEKHEVTGGSLWVYELAQGAQAEITVRAARGLSIGGKRSVRIRVTGGTAGFIVDARGRPLALATDVRTLAAQLSTWYAQATGDPIREVNVEWLEAVIASNIAGADPAAAPVGRARRRQKRSAGSDGLPEVPVAEPPPRRSRAVRSIDRSKQQAAPKANDPLAELSDDELRDLLS